MKNIFAKALKPEDLTELSVEWIVHETENYKKLTLITTIIGGKVHTKYGVIAHDFCILITKSQKKAIKKYNLVSAPVIQVSSSMNAL